MSPVFVALLALLASTFRTRAAQQAEIAALRHQIAVLQRSSPRRLRLKQPDRLLWDLRQLLLLPSTEKTREVLKQAGIEPTPSSGETSGVPTPPADRSADKKPGHGRNGANAGSSSLCPRLARSSNSEHPPSHSACGNHLRGALSWRAPAADSVHPGLPRCARSEASSAYPRAVRENTSQLPCLPTTTWVDSSSTSDLRRFGAVLTSAIDGPWRERLWRQKPARLDTFVRIRMDSAS